MPPDQNHYGSNTATSTPQGGQDGSSTPAAPTFLQGLMAKLGNQATPQPTPVPQADPSKPAELPKVSLADIFSQAPAKVDTPDPSKVVDHFAVSQEGLQAKFGGLNVAQYIAPELMTKAMGGDMEAFQQVINQTASISAMAAYSQSAATAKEGLASGVKSLEDILPAKFKNMNLDSSIDTHALYSQPHMKPVANALRTEFLSRFPQASNSDVIELIDNFFKETGANSASDPSKKPAQQPDATNFQEMFNNILKN